MGGGPERGNYLDLLGRIHRALRPRGYLEIGVRDGASLALAEHRTRVVGVDPAPVLADRRYPAHMRVFTSTSDDYFGSHDLADDLGVPLDLAFVDGMHLFEFALRDFRNIERFAHAGTVVLVHDCYPLNEATAARECRTLCWSGDVWKLVVCLKEARPDLVVSVVDVPPTGLGIVTRLDASSRVLDDRYDELVSRHVDAPYSTLVADKAATLNRIDNHWSRIAALLSPSVRSGYRRFGIPRRSRARVER